MNFNEVKDQLEAQKKSLIDKLANKQFTKEEIETIQMSIDNYQYIIELTEMNNYERGFHH